MGTNLTDIQVEDGQLKSLTFSKYLDSFLDGFQTSISRTGTSLAQLEGARGNISKILDKGTFELQDQSGNTLMDSITFTEGNTGFVSADTAKRDYNNPIVDLAESKGYDPNGWLDNALNQLDVQNIVLKPKTSTETSEPQKTTETSSNSNQKKAKAGMAAGAAALVAAAGLAIAAAVFS